MRPSWSLRQRLGISLAVGVTVIWLAGALIAGVVVRHELDETFDSALQETAQRLLTLAVLDIIDHEGALTERRVAPLSNDEEFEHDEFLTYLVRDNTGNILLHSHDSDRSVFPAEPRTGFSTSASHRIYGESAVSNTIFIEIAEPLDHRREAAMESIVSLVIPLALILPFSFLGVWWLVDRSLRPVLGLRTQIEARDAGDLSAVNSDDLPDEIRPIVTSVNRLMERLQRSLQAERSFTANSAHELRTPIAGALAQTQRLLSSLADDEIRDRVRTIETALQRLGRISDKLMQLARAEGGGVVAETESDLGPYLDAVVDEFRRSSSSGQQIAYSGAPPGALTSHMDGDALGILMRNLIENALRYGPDGSQIDIVATDGCIRVINAGTVLAPDLLARLTEPFVRGQTEMQGCGLGLAIAQAIAQGGGISLDLLSPATGRDDGFEAIVTFEKATSANNIDD